VGGVAVNAGGGANLEIDGALYLSALSKSLAAIRVRETMNARANIRAANFLLATPFGHL
jgi:hypothetical protein